MEKCLLVSQCVRQLDPSSTTNEDQPSILGLSSQQVMELMPSEKVSHKNAEHSPTDLEENDLFGVTCEFV